VWLSVTYASLSISHVDRQLLMVVPKHCGMGDAAHSIRARSAAIMNESACIDYNE